ncbi:MAG: TatD family nuclease-associated radical SAM protein [Oscillospiraceae bacterium]|nr:TatD family nuclease-associated radical SAM protein [Oscillospiraceae bacterium]
MKKAMTLSYEVGNNLYINITNQCSCNCSFCIRKNDDGAYGSDPLWLDHEPSMSEMQNDLSQRDLSQYQELVFCGYGEPTMRLDFACDLAHWLKQTNPALCLRLNTNGLADIYSPSEKGSSADLVSQCFDKVSVSLNGGDSDTYLRVTNPKNRPDHAYHTMLRFAQTCKQNGLDTCFTVVDVISPDEIRLAQEVADTLQIPLHVRNYIS